MIVAGFGFRASADVSSLRNALATTGSAPQKIATASAKSNHPALLALARELNVPVVGVSMKALNAQATLTRSRASQAAYDTGSVAESAALAAAGQSARLVAPRSISNDRLATCAIAEGDL